MKKAVCAWCDSLKRGTYLINIVFGFGEGSKKRGLSRHLIVIRAHGREPKVSQLLINENTRYY